jgi:hypothetical protein
MISPPVIIQEAQTFFFCSYLLFMSAKTLALSPMAPESFHNTTYSDELQKIDKGFQRNAIRRFQDSIKIYGNYIVL